MLCGHINNFCKKVKDVRPSTACVSLLGEKNAKGIFGKVIDALFAVSILAGVVTCVGTNVPTLFAIIGRSFGIQMSFQAEAVVIIMWSVVMALLLYTGLSKGIKYLSNFRVVVGFGLLAFLLIVGPTSYILNGTLDNIGMYLQNIVRLTFNTDTYAASGTPQNWTVFYWCWYLALAITNGLFFAKILPRPYRKTDGYRCSGSSDTGFMAVLRCISELLYLHSSEPSCEYGFHNCNIRTG